MNLKVEIQSMKSCLSYSEQIESKEIQFWSSILQVITITNKLNSKLGLKAESKRLVLQMN